MNWTRLAYGSIIPTVAATAIGTYLGLVIRIFDVARIGEAVMERTAAVEPWGFSTNAYSGNLAGYDTNVSGSVSWSFNNYAGGKILLLASVGPRSFWSSTLQQITNIIPKFAKQSDTNGNVIMHSVTNLFDILDIGNGTSLWTIGVNTNGEKIYSNDIGSVVSTCTVDEIWRVLAALHLTTNNMTLGYIWPQRDRHAIEYVNSDRYNPTNDNLWYEVLPDQDIMDAWWTENEGPWWENHAIQDTPQWASFFGYNFLTLTNLSTYGSAQTNIYESWFIRFRPEVYYQRKMIRNYEPVPDDIGYTDYSYLDVGYAGDGEYREERWRNYQEATILVPHFPSGVVANISMIYMITGAYTISNYSGTYTGSYYGPMTGFADRITFTGTVAVGTYTNASVKITPDMTRMIPTNLMQHSLSPFAMDTSRRTETVLGDPVYSYILDEYWVDTTFFTGRLDVINNTNIHCLIDWQFIYTNK